MGAAPSACLRNCCMNSLQHENAEDLLKGTDQPVGHPSTSSRAGAEGPGQAVLGVPPVSGWLQAIKRQRGQQIESPRFDEVHASPRQAAASGASALGSPRSVGGEFQTPRDTPRLDTDGSNGGKTEEVYEGPYQNGLWHGPGVLRSANATYTGQFEQGCKHGHGTLRWNDGRCYSGQFEQSKFHGSAVMTWPDGRVFDGQYARDRKHGDGTFSWSDGRRYSGQWVCGKRQGVGIYTNAKSITRRGWWQNDRPVHWDPEDVLDPMAARGPEEPGAEALPPPPQLPDADGAEPPEQSRVAEAAEPEGEEAQLDLEDRPGAMPITRPVAVTTPRSGASSPRRSPRQVAVDAI